MSIQILEINYREIILENLTRSPLFPLFPIEKHIKLPNFTLSQNGDHAIGSMLTKGDY